MTETVELDLRIENHYATGVAVTTERVKVAIRKSGDVVDTDWADDQIFPATGTGETEGDAAYFVAVVASDAPGLIPIGTEWEFGL